MAVRRGADAAAPGGRGLGSSSAVVCTPTSNAGAVATYKAAGFEQLPETRDRRRDAQVSPNAGEVPGSA
ncbi:hypothetical protein CEB94_11920 [Streptomyces hawaiiensis]|uniref:Uncharacterized protein n=1 Tax=Streptomyces hawaiiensis TaxID=67305 RepID=A0A6G5RC95_9ACTN|nr:hypothetical protein CEB94_11920 [Streptomyces hawaiiensis]